MSKEQEMAAAARERVRKALVECGREHKRLCKDPVVELGKVQARNERARRRADGG